MGDEQHIADPCMYFSKNKVRELAIWLSWVDDDIILGTLHVMKVEGEK